ncbi:MAG: hypothetical protein GX119_01040 [Syntrophomonadaceae bacterium]|nr:hypothetical protein [Syntrophomonadaceae bacterium]
MINIIIAFVVLFILLELPGLRKRLCWRELLVIMLLLTVSSLYGIACHLHSSILLNPKQCLYLAQPLATAFHSLIETGEEP